MPPLVARTSLNLHLRLGHLADASIQSSYIKYICQGKEKQQYISDGAVRIFIETSAKHFQFQVIQTSLPCLPL